MTLSGNHPHVTKLPSVNEIEINFQFEYTDRDLEESPGH